MKLHLGVVDLPYNNDPGGKSTGDVADILEAKYGVMARFWELHGAEVVDAMASDFVALLEERQLGAPAGRDPYAGAMDVAKNLFSRFLESKELDGLVDGVPTAASLAGVSHRFKRKKGAPGRPSFVDTGQFEASFKAWMDQQG